MVTLHVLNVKQRGKMGVDVVESSQIQLCDNVMPFF